MKCIFYAANNLIKILCVRLGPIKVIIEGATGTSRMPNRTPSHTHTHTYINK